jgi:threonine/homoserine/homoserine lactone efflux protein
VGTLRDCGRAAARGLALALLNPTGIALILLLFVVAKRSAGGPYLDQNLLVTVLITVPLTCAVALAAHLIPGLSAATRKMVRPDR